MRSDSFSILLHHHRARWLQRLHGAGSLQPRDGWVFLERARLQGLDQIGRRRGIHGVHDIIIVEYSGDRIPLLLAGQWQVAVLVLGRAVARRF